jgi:hypothetical protein
MRAIQKHARLCVLVLLVLYVRFQPIPLGKDCSYTVSDAHGEAGTVKQS